MFSPLKSIEFESDKVSAFFLANRLAKCTIGLSEFDRAIGNIEKMGKVSIDKRILNFIINSKNNWMKY
jgi:hypothetical protein